MNGVNKKLLTSESGLVTNKMRCATYDEPIFDIVIISLNEKFRSIVDFI